MEVAGQWRREWAGAAEYGKVTEGGVTRQVARAMEVLHASAPGTRVRVMRAAYHSSSGPGIPASSYMLHSSRRVISSGASLLSSPSFTNKSFGDTPSLPLEISSTPLELLPDNNTDTENYKVTEPDDLDISEPSKWKGSTGKNSIRMPSEESSSTDNASIIDLDPRNTHKSIFRKYSYDSENSDIQPMKLGSRLSPLLDAPTSLSTLKYKSLLNNSNDWNNRRKSYSFEDTSPLNESILHCNDTLAMESSTDSGICKSTELVNDHTEYERKDRRDSQDESFKDWLHKSRSTSFNKNVPFKSHRTHGVVIEEPSESNITLQSKGKVSITVPITIEDGYEYKNDRREKKVEFCRTELHFAAESGKVNIIATDDKPPPSNDFRKRKSAFLPMNDKPERPITLLGLKKDYAVDNAPVDEILRFSTSETVEHDENTAATKSILKNKIPKPKPYLLGENMAFGKSSDPTKQSTTNNISGGVPTAVSLINSQLQSERRLSNETSTFSSETDTNVHKIYAPRPTHLGFAKSASPNKAEHNVREMFSTSETKDTTNSVQNKLKLLQMSPIQGRSKTRQLRQSDLTYFGIENSKKPVDEKPKYIRDRIKMQNDAIDNIFHSVRLIQQVSNSVCNSEAESEESPDYQNVPFKANFAPIPTPRLRTKFIDESKENSSKSHSNAVNNEYSLQENTQERRSRLRKHEEFLMPSNRSISEPPKVDRCSSLQKPRRRQKTSRLETSTRSSNHQKLNSVATSPYQDTSQTHLSDEHETTPLYVNFNVNVDEKLKDDDLNIQTNIKKDYRKESEQRERIRNKYDSSDKVKQNTKDSLQKKSNSLRKKKNDSVAGENSDRRSSDRSTGVRTATKESRRTGDKSTSSSKRQEKVMQNSGVEPKKIAPEVILAKNIDGTYDSTKPKISNNVSQQLNNKINSRNGTARRESTEGQHKSRVNSADRHRNSLQNKSIDKNGDIYNTNKDIKKKSKRNEYVINYDDKNGTVSSICKVTTAPGSTKKKKISLEKIKDQPKEYKSHDKASDKQNLLQFPDRVWNPNGLSYADKRSKTKVHIQRTCQLL